MTRVFTAIIHKENNIYVAECPEVGTASQRYSIEEALENLREATEVYLEEFPAESSSHPILATFEVPVHA
jgi:predicted RNase H-like HicB family nuclease